MIVIQFDNHLQVGLIKHRYCVKFEANPQMANYSEQKELFNATVIVKLLDEGGYNLPTQ